MLVFESDELERTEEFLSTHYAPMRIGSTTKRSPARIARTAAGSVSVDQLDLQFAMSYDVAPLGKICLCDIAAGAVEDHAVAGQPGRETFGAGEVFSFAPPDRPYQGRINRARYSITMFDPGLLDQLASPARDREPVRLLGHRPVTPIAGERLRRAIEHLDRYVLADPAVGDSPLLVAAASRYLAACVLDAFPNTALIDPTATDRRDARPATVRRAVAYIEAHADSDISPADIAAAAHVTVRALQHAFRRHLDSTPMEYLRRVRLEGARRDLLAADPASGSTVTAIANRWGFLHQGRFGVNYRRAYGESPGQTLRG
jgi:AraC-like DNA-binding protein